VEVFSGPASFFLEDPKEEPSEGEGRSDLSNSRIRVFLILDKRKKVEPSPVRVGRGAGEEILKVIRQANKSLFVVSPWISPSLADLLVRREREGIRVEVVTLNDPSTNGEALRRLFRTERKLRLPLLICGSLLTLLGLVFLQEFLYPSLLLLFAGLFAMLLGRGRGRMIANVTRAVALPPSSGLHAKIYLADENILLVGSPNLTIAGIRSNLEAVAKLKISEEEARKIRAIFFPQPDFLVELGKRTSLPPTP